MLIYIFIGIVIVIVIVIISILVFNYKKKHTKSNQLKSTKYFWNEKETMLLKNYLYRYQEDSNDEKTIYCVINYVKNNYSYEKFIKIIDILSNSDIINYQNKIEKLDDYILNFVYKIGNAEYECQKKILKI